MTQVTISKFDDVIDSRDIIQRIEDLEEIGDARTEEENEELDNLKAFADETEQYAADWKYGITLIQDSYFETYAQELAEEIGAVPDNAPWPCTCIDWEQAARELQMDYTAIEFDGVRYWVR